MHAKPSIRRFPLIFVSMLTLVLATWGGLLRAGWTLPTPFPTLPAGHGPLMISGFLGTLIGMERAVALGTPWTYAAPVLSAAGGIGLMLGAPDWLGALLFSGAGGVVVAVFTYIVRRQPELFNQVLRAGAAAWTAGNLLWLLGRGVAEVVLWWSAFLILTIAGERLELNRLLRPGARSRAAFLASAATIVAGALAALVEFSLGWRVAGLGMLGLAAWLLTSDIARRTVRQQGLTRYIAVCLLSGYVWLGVGGAMALGISIQRLFVYDAILHAVFLGFVFAMIFGHAPVIFPAVMGVSIPMRPAFYAHLALLHLSLALRVVGDLAQIVPLRRWGAVLNGIALLLFIANTVLAIVAARRAAADSALLVQPVGHRTPV